MNKLGAFELIVFILVAVGLIIYATGKFIRSTIKNKGKGFWPNVLDWFGDVIEAMFG